jgi:hypothetical protein
MSAEWRPYAYDPEPSPPRGHLMDPKATLVRIRELTAELAAHPRSIAVYSDILSERWDLRRCADELAELVTALDEWLSQGGFLPDGWQPKEQG